MKIAEVIATFPPYHGGMGYVCYHNALQLARRGHEVRVFTLDHRRSAYTNDPSEFQVTRLRTPLLYGDGGVVPQLYFRLKGFDVVHLHYPFFGGAEYVYLSSLFRGDKYFLTYHMDVLGNTPFKKAVIRCYDAVLQKQIIGRAARIGALTFEHLKSSAVAGFVDWNRVIEMPNGVDVRLFAPGPPLAELQDRYRLKGKKVALFVGNLQPFKGLHLLIDALSRVEDRGLVLLVVGGGYAEQEYRRQVHSRDMDDRVIFAGPQTPGKGLEEHYRLADFLVLPSTHSEAFPLVVLEAMATGKPAIVSSLPGPSQLVSDGRDGLIARVGDVEDLREKIAYLAGNDSIRSTMGKEAVEKVRQRYSWDSVGVLLEQALLETMNAHD